MDTTQQQHQQLQEHDVQQHQLQLQQHSPAAHTSSLMDSSSPPPSPGDSDPIATTANAATMGHRPHSKTMVYSAPGSPVADDTPTLVGGSVNTPAPIVVNATVDVASDNSNNNTVQTPMDSSATPTTTTTPPTTQQLPASGGRMQRRVHMARSTIAAASGASTPASVPAEAALPGQGASPMRRTWRAFQAYRTAPTTNNMMAVLRNSSRAEINRLMVEMERRRVQRQLQPQQQQQQQQQQPPQQHLQQRMHQQGQQILQSLQHRQQLQRQHQLQQLLQHQRQQPTQPHMQQQQQQPTQQNMQQQQQQQPTQQQQEYMQRQQFVVQQQPETPRQQQQQPPCEITLLQQQQQREQQDLRVVRQIRTLLQQQGGDATVPPPPHSTAGGNGSPRTMHVDGIPLPVNILKGRYLLASEVPAAAALQQQQQQGRSASSYRHLVDLNSSHLRCTDVFTERSYLCKVVNEPLYKVQRAYFNLLQADDEANRSSLLGHQLIRGVHDIVPQNRQRTFIIISPHTDADALGRGGREDAVFEDLHTYIRNKRRVGETEARALFHQICQTVQVCHRNGIILRDLKLKRFYFIDEERTKLQYESLEGCMILDDPNDDTLSDKIGCPLYTAPELLCPRPTYRGKPADIWSMGVILYTMLVGQYPFYEKVNCNLITIIRHCQVQIPSSLSRPVRWLLLLLLRKKHEERIKADDILHLPWMRKQRAHYMPVPAGLWLGDDEDVAADKMDASMEGEGGVVAAETDGGASLEGSQRSEDIIENITMEQCIDREEGDSSVPSSANSSVASSAAASSSSSSSVDDHNYAIAANEGVASASSASPSSVDSSVRPLDYRLVTLEQQLMQLHQQVESLLGEGA